MTEDELKTLLEDIQKTMFRQAKEFRDARTKTVHNMEELAILGVVILIRAALAFIIHWEIKAEENSGLQKQTTADK